MRLWTLHPRYLDSKGLVALWREGLLAQAVLLERTRGYRNHPQLLRFKAARNPLSAITSYLQAVWREASHRGYRFNVSHIAEASPLSERLVETRGQLLFEWSHLQRKLLARAPALHMAHRSTFNPIANPVFRIVRGGVRPWERSAEYQGTERRA